MRQRHFGREFKIEAVRLINDRGVCVAQASLDLDVHENQSRKLLKLFSADPAQAFRGHGPLKPEKREIDKLRREVAKLKGGARDHKKSRSLLREGRDMRFTFIAKYREIWPVAWLCEALDVSRSGFHAWLNHRRAGVRATTRRLAPRVWASFVGSDRT
jgi:transposase-like protein